MPMKSRRQKFSFLKKCLLIFSLLGLLLSCEKTPSVSYIGETIDINELCRATTEIFSAEIDEAARVFWSDGGGVWHIKEDCPSLKKSKEIKSGTAAEALAEGKERVCQKCSK